MKSTIKKRTWKAIYRLLDRVSPLPYDCGALCNAACCCGGSDGFPFAAATDAEGNPITANEGRAAAFDSPSALDATNSKMNDVAEGDKLSTEEVAATKQRIKDRLDNNSNFTRFKEYESGAGDFHSTDKSKFNSKNFEGQIKAQGEAA